MHALVVSYDSADPTATERAELLDQLTPALDAASGLLGRMRLGDSRGAMYVFETKAAFDRFVASELFAAAYDGVPGLTARDFAIHEQGGTRCT
jgi:hypothetical protein